MTDFHRNAQHLAIDMQDDQRNIMQHPRYLSPGSISPVAGMFSLFSSIRPDFLDMVFLDGDHRYESVMDDIKVQCRFVKGKMKTYKFQNQKPRSGVKAWWPKLRSGGVLAGHDFAVNFPGVVQVRMPNGKEEFFPNSTLRQQDFEFISFHSALECRPPWTLHCLRT